LAPEVDAQVQELSEKIPQAFEQVKAKVSEQSWGRKLLDRADANQLMKHPGKAWSQASGFLSATFGAAANIVIILFIALFISIEPTLYRRGIVSLFPLDQRKRTEEVLSGVYKTLQWWLIGKFGAMAIIGVCTAIGLWLLGIPLALALGLLAALLTFIPNIGPILSAIPAVLLAFTNSPTMGLYVVLLYAGVQAVESYVITPLFQRKTVSLPPALTLSSQVALGTLLGGMGLALATPLMAATIVVVKMVYVQDVLGDKESH
jgi:predicted PurR-regulated permease PerM